jgi:hypothetical protein
MEMALQNRKGTIWRGSPALIILLASLCFSLFVWGIGYKLSLYKASERHHPSMPEAKLLSQKERPVVSAKLQTQIPHGKPLRLPLTAFLTGAFALALADSSVPFIISAEVENFFNNTPAVYSRPPPSCI